MTPGISPMWLFLKAMSKRKRLASAIGILFAISGTLFFFQLARRSDQNYILATGRHDGLYHRLGTTVVASLASSERTGYNIELFPTTGSISNINLLRLGKVDFGFSQLDAASAHIYAGEVSPIAILAQEDLLLLSRDCSSHSPTHDRNEPFSFLDGCIINIGRPGSGVQFTANRLLGALGSQVISSKESNTLPDALERLKKGSIDSLFYVGRLSADSPILSYLATKPYNVKLRSVDSTAFSYLSSVYPGSYSKSVVPAGRFGLDPVLPSQDLETISVPTVLLARPNVNPSFVRQLTWSILSNYRNFVPFYPDLLSQRPSSALTWGLQSLDPSASDVFANGDPRQAWIRYWERNSDLQAGVFILLGTSLFGYFFRFWMKQRSKTLLSSVNSRLLLLAEELELDPKSTLAKIDEIVDETRLQFIASRLNDDAYGLIVKRTQSLADKCRSAIESSRRKSVLDSLVVFDEWQIAISEDPSRALQLVSQMKARYSEMLLDGEIDIAAYIELTELVLLSEVKMKS